MSIPALNWVFRGAAPGLLRGATRHVLTCLADHATDDMIAWPGVHTIAKETGLAARSVQRALRALESGGYIKAVGARVGGRGATRYRLIVIHISQTGDDTVSSQGRHGVIPGATQRHPRGDMASPEPPPTRQISIIEPPGAHGRAGGGDKKKQNSDELALATYLDTLPARDREAIEIAIASHTPSHPLKYAQTVAERLRREDLERQRGQRPPTRDEIERLAARGESWAEAELRITRKRAIAARSLKSSRG